MGEVDRFFDDVVATQQSDQPSGAQPDQQPAPAPGPPEQAPEPHRAPPASPGRAPTERPSVIEEKPGLWSRITGRNR